MTFVVPPGVYAPQDDTALLAGSLQDEVLPPRAQVLDVGTGTGALALAAALRGAQVTAVDISRRAVWTARLNATLAGKRVRVLRGDLTAPVAGRTFDLIVTNPPYVPSPAVAQPRRGPARAWEGGSDGRLILDRICAEAPPLLRQGGVLLVVHSALSGEARTLERLRSAGLRAMVTERRFVTFGPVLRSRRSWLRHMGLLGPDGDKEELVVIRAERPQ
ncbi:release factor glutamine methyltransferase [Streptomyces sp. SLBN-118]|uniref:HemK2/MTQ2 family protein methyltransferase n=1 Tax=Streptomyces sp. SLBN-118 TaxID=2768454 RepID=UPI0011536B8E|nr:HemK2/MTQ2 family protein methyltransferase [Streptomyces sp. SLBN-118]TQK42669.1 release factor glutamine methyltransferase [Streptomyces sp. SLBN-118]